jgi:hypothetical protein
MQSLRDIYSAQPISPYCPYISPLWGQYGTEFSNPHFWLSFLRNTAKPVAKNMKNPTAKTYEGPKNYRKLVQNVLKLYSLSDKQLEVTNPFEKNLIMTHTQISKSLPSHKDPANDSSPTTNDNVAICSYLNKPMTSRGKLESRQINEVAGRSLNIWRSSKKRLSNALCASATVPSGATPSLKEKNTANNFGDY